MGHTPSVWASETKEALNEFMFQSDTVENVCSGAVTKLFAEYLYLRGVGAKAKVKNYVIIQL